MIKVYVTVEKLRLHCTRLRVLTPVKSALQTIISYVQCRIRSLLLRPQDDLTCAAYIDSYMYILLLACFIKLIFFLSTKDLESNNVRNDWQSLYPLTVYKTASFAV